MSRSRKYPMDTLSKRCTDNIHARIRGKVKRELLKSEFDVTVVEGTAHNLAMEDWGTKLGFDTTSLLNEREIQEREKMMRK